MIVVHFHQRFRLSTSDVGHSFTESSIGWVTWVGDRREGVGDVRVSVRRRLRGAVAASRAGRPADCPALSAAAGGTGRHRDRARDPHGIQLLLDYAIWGVPLLFMRKWPTRILLAVAVVSAAAWAFRPLWMGIHDGITLGREGANAALASISHVARPPVVPPASYADVVLTRLHGISRGYLTWWVLIPQVRSRCSSSACWPFVMESSTSRAGTSG